MAKYVIVGKMVGFGKVKTYQSNNALKKSQKPAGLEFFVFLAETKGFEPLIPLRVYYISNVAH